MTKEAKKAITDCPGPRKATLLEEGRKSATEQVAAVSNSTIEAYCED